MPFDRREELMTADPETYFITDHYRNYPWILVSLSKLHPDAPSDLLQTAYRAASPAKIAADDSRVPQFPRNDSTSHGPRKIRRPRIHPFCVLISAS